MIHHASGVANHPDVVPIAGVIGFCHRVLDAFNEEFANASSWLPTHYASFEGKLKKILVEEGPVFTKLKVLKGLRVTC